MRNWLNCVMFNLSFKDIFAPFCRFYRKYKVLLPWVLASKIEELNNATMECQTDWSLKELAGIKEQSESLAKQITQLNDKYTVLAQRVDDFLAAVDSRVDSRLSALRLELEADNKQLQDVKLELQKLQSDCGLRGLPTGFVSLASNQERSLAPASTANTKNLNNTTSALSGINTDRTTDTIDSNNNSLYDLLLRNFLKDYASTGNMPEDTRQLIEKLRKLVLKQQSIANSNAALGKGSPEVSFTDEVIKQDFCRLFFCLYDYAKDNHKLKAADKLKGELFTAFSLLGLELIDPCTDDAFNVAEHFTVGTQVHDNLRLRGKIAGCKRPGMRFRSHHSQADAILLQPAQVIIYI